jgi:hypothetical protein
LLLIEELLQELSQGRTALQVIHSDDVLQGKMTVQGPVHTYQLLGGDQLRRTQTSNLMSKVEEAGRQRQGEEQEETSEAEKEVELYRYFKSNVRCFRCKKVGHHKYSCLDEASCFFCLSLAHPSEKCPQRTVCYQCYQWGHIIN